MNGPAFKSSLDIEQVVANSFRGANPAPGLKFVFYGNLSRNVNVYKRIKTGVMN